MVGKDGETKLSDTWTRQREGKRRKVKNGRERKGGENDLTNLNYVIVCFIDAGSKKTNVCVCLCVCYLNLPV